MTFPYSPAHYGLTLPREVIEEIESLTAIQLLHTLSNVADTVAGLTVGFDSTHLNWAIDEMICNSLKTKNDWLLFMQWVLDGAKQAHN